VFSDSTAYERFMGRWSARLAALLLDLAALGEPRRVLDVGSGTGNLARAVLDRWPGCRVTGVDPSEAFVAASRARFDGAPVTFTVGSAADLRLPDHSVDAALANLVVNFVPEPARGVEEMARVTRPRGVLAATVWDYGGGMAMLRTFWDAAADVLPSSGGVDEALMGPARAGGLRALWSGAGLDDVTEGTVDVPMRFADFADYWEPFLGGIGPAGALVAGLAEDERSALREELRRRLGEGPIELTSTARWVRGVVPAG